MEILILGCLGILALGVIGVLGYLFVLYNGVIRLKFWLKRRGVGLMYS